ncbi:Hypothetical protein HVR_LOCUS364 [uncultured virus]|nr:Hypothetical protein HVR_LOCUS364 [uncultured virus]
MALLGVTKIPTVIINAYDLMWYDVDLRYNDRNPFFFKIDPVNYLRNLQNEGWVIYLYSGLIANEIEKTRFDKRHARQYLTQKLGIIMTLFMGIITATTEEENLQDIIANVSPASFIIIDPARPFYERITRYSPIEIFELVDPPTILPSAIVTVVDVDSVKRREEVQLHLEQITELPISIIPRNIHERFETLRHLRTQYPDRPILIVWSPVYRYSENDHPEENRYYRFERPDHEYNLRDVIVYIWGY